MSVPPAAKIGLRSPRFLAFLAGQFLGAANDNAFKVTVIVTVLATVADESTQVLYSSFAAALFPVPFLLFSPIAGYFADRFPKHRVLVAAKVPEIVAMALAIVGFHLSSLPFLLGVLFLMATQSAFFSPAKYGILPEVFDDSDLSLANGYLELATNMAILFGNVVGIWVYGVFADDLAWAGVTYFGVALVGTAAIAFAPRAPLGDATARPTWSILQSAKRDWGEVRKVPALFYAVFGIAYFGFLGSVLLTILPVFGKNSMGLDEQSAGLLLAVLSIGIAVGSVLAGRLSQGRVELGLVPLGGLGIFLFSFDLALFGAGGETRLAGIPLRAIVDLLCLGASAGFYIIPLNALLQSRSPKGMKGRLIAFSNVLTFSAVLLAAAVPMGLTSIGLSTDEIILAVTLVTSTGAFYVMNLLPDFFVRLVFWVATNTAYRIRTVGEDRLPHGGALFVANHVSWVDFLFIGAACDRMLRFLMFRGYYEWSWLNGFFRRMHAIPVAAGDSREQKEESLGIARREIADGNAVCIFAEGAISRTGNLLKFKRGLEQIAQGVDCPIVPIYLDGVWGSLFSFEGGRFFFKRPRGFRSLVTVVFGDPLPSSASARDVRSAIQQLSAEAFAERAEAKTTVGEALVRSLRTRPLRRAISEGRATSSAAGALHAAARRARALLARVGDASRIGVLLPAGAEAAHSLHAVALAGKCAVPLDPQADASLLRFMIESTELRHVIAATGDSSIADIEAAGASVLAAEALAASPLTFSDRLAIWSLPAARVAKHFAGSEAPAPEDAAALLFSYPEDAPGRPVAATIRHGNLLSNWAALSQVFRTEADDCLLGLLAPSNAMGFFATIWLPVFARLRVHFARDVAALAADPRALRTARVSLLASSPELLAEIAASIPPSDLPALRFVASGGGALDPAVATGFAERFGVDPAEGFGLPECAPVISLNVPDATERQLGTRPGSHGQPLPGISLRFRDPATGADLPPGESGRLWVHGPNVMSGYANDAERSARVLRDGWFDTGVLAHLDADGFLTLD